MICHHHSQKRVQYVAHVPMRIVHERIGFSVYYPSVYWSISRSDTTLQGRSGGFDTLAFLIVSISTAG